MSALNKLHSVIEQYKKGEASINTLTLAIEEAEKEKREEELLQRAEQMRQPLPQNVELANVRDPNHNIVGMNGGAKRRRKKNSKRKKSKRSKRKRKRKSRR